MKLLTSYFGRVSMVTNPVAICGGVPDWYTGAWYKSLAPRWSFFDAYKRGKITEEGYTTEYNRQVLSRLDPHEVIEDLLELFPPGTDVITMLCYEKPGEFCHRNLVAAWFDSYDITVKEFEPVQGHDSDIIILGDIG